MKSASKHLARKYFCELCVGVNPYREPKAFTRKGDLTRHQNTHTGRRAYRCNFLGCGKKFSQAAGLKTHINVHTGEKPYACGLGDCKSSFGDPSSCARHRKETHRRPAGYRCPIEDCKTSIKRKSVFTDHLSKKHGLVFQDQEIESCLPLSLPKLPSILPTPSPTPSSPKAKIRSKHSDRPSPNFDNEWVDDSKVFDPTFLHPESAQLPEPYLSWNHNWGQEHYPVRASSSAHIYDGRVYQQDQHAISANTTPSTSPTSGAYPVTYPTNPIVYKNPVYMATPHGSDAYQKDLHYSYNTTLALPDTTIHMGIDFSRNFTTGHQGNTSTGSMFYNYP